MPSTSPPPLASPFRSAGERAGERERKREALLLAAVRMFNARGFNATSLDDVAASLGVTKPVIYRYLGNKEQVLLECITRGIEQLRAEADSARRRDGSGLDRLTAFLRSYAEINMSEFGMCVIRTDEATLSEEGAERFRALKRGVDTALRALIEAGVADGSVVATDVRLTAFTLAGALNWPAHWFRTDGELSAAELAERMVETLLVGLRPR